MTQKLKSQVAKYPSSWRSKKLKSQVTSRKSGEPSRNHGRNFRREEKLLDRVFLSVGSSPVRSRYLKVEVINKVSIGVGSCQHKSRAA